MERLVSWRFLYSLLRLFFSSPCPGPCSFAFFPRMWPPRDSSTEKNTYKRRHSRRAADLGIYLQSQKKERQKTLCVDLFVSIVFHLHYRLFLSAAVAAERSPRWRNSWSFFFFFLVNSRVISLGRCQSQFSASFVVVRIDVEHVSETVAYTDVGCAHLDFYQCQVLSSVLPRKHEPLEKEKKLTVQSLH